MNYSTVYLWASFHRNADRLSSLFLFLQEREHTSALYRQDSGLQHNGTKTWKQKSAYSFKQRTSELTAISLCNGHSVHHQLVALQSDIALINSLLKLKHCPEISPGVTYCQHRMLYLSCSPIYGGGISVQDRQPLVFFKQTLDLDSAGLRGRGVLMDYSFHLLKLTSLEHLLRTHIHTRSVGHTDTHT